ncbi:MAG: hypothetical protein DI598_00615 [Pseudopedobacter saltans]|uniref:Uncharacterized protein n=1 Tax=Pseudopedobacter saltans TaxID=151895 RepID=A0A2W5FAP4_9SPHI|nr:MAG: hypothetical protein DI598_00615 [Pseudopedobacter saltans]
MKKIICLGLFGVLISCSKSESTPDYVDESKYLPSDTARKWVNITPSNNSLWQNGNKVLSTSFVDNNGNYYIAGYLFGGFDGNFVAKWDGTNWSKVGSGTAAFNPNNDIDKICVNSKGYVYATGKFTDADHNRYVAEWNNNEWHSIGSIPKISGKQFDFLTSMICDNDDNIIICLRNMRGDSSYIYKWNKTNWSLIGKPVYRKVKDGDDVFSSVVVSGPILTTDEKNNIYFGDEGDNGSYLAKWNGNVWEILKGPNNYYLRTGGLINCIKENVLYIKAVSYNSTSAELKYENGSWSEVSVPIKEIGILSYQSQTHIPYTINSNEKKDNVFLYKSLNNSWFRLGNTVPLAYYNGISDFRIDIDNKGTVYLALRGANSDSTYVGTWMLKN